MPSREERLKSCYRKSFRAYINVGSCTFCLCFLDQELLGDEVNCGLSVAFETLNLLYTVMFVISRLQWDECVVKISNSSYMCCEMAICKTLLDVKLLGNLSASILLCLILSAI
ncbi:hypothetical protein M758_3G264500 [Ceratodon purpureus]|nr:hypothetical protein M758_3G264500 [Ceratodon purpureus]